MSGIIQAALEDDTEAAKCM